jgi:hypothetical protein
VALSTTPRSRRAPPPPPTTSLASPTLHELLAAPELAVLVALQQLLELTTLTLAAIHPELIGDRSYLRRLDAQAALADQLIKLGARLAKATISYRAAALAALLAPDTDDLPF